MHADADGSAILACAVHENVHLELALLILSNNFAFNGATLPYILRSKLAQLFLGAGPQKLPLENAIFLGVKKEEKTKKARKKERKKETSKERQKETKSTIH